jgi:hypothetical protein
MTDFTKMTLATAAIALAVAAEGREGVVAGCGVRVCNVTRKRHTLLGVLALAAGSLAGCKKGGGDAADGAADASTERAIVHCADVDGGVGDDGGKSGGNAGDDGGAAIATDEFGPNAPAVKTASALGRVNIYEITTPTLLARVDVYLRADLAESRLTIAIQEATSRTGAFTKLTDVQIDVAVCEGWASSGALAIPMEVGRFYAIGFDPNQPVIDYVSSDTDSLPIDGAFGRLIGSKTATSVSVSTLTWDKLTDKEYNRQRLLTSPRAGGAPPAGGTGDAAGDASTDGLRDAAADATKS